MAKNFAGENEIGEKVEQQSGLKPGWLCMVFAVLFTLLNAFLGFFNQYGRSTELSAAIGGALSGLMLGLLVVLLFQIFRRFRNPKSRWKIYAWTIFLLFLGAVTNVLQRVAVIA